MEYTFKRDLKNSFMVTNGSFDDMGYEKDILKNNDIDILVPFHTVSINNRMQVWYDITGLVSLKDYMLQQGITLELIRKVLVYLKIAIEQTQRFLIDTNHLYLDADTIFVVKDNSQWKLMLIYYPDNSEEASLGKLMEFFMENARESIMESCIRLYDVSLDGVGIDGLIRIIDEENDYDEVGLSVEETVNTEENYFDSFEESGDIFDEEKEPTLLDKIREMIANRLGYEDIRSEGIRSEGIRSEGLFSVKKRTPKVEHFKKAKKGRDKKGNTSQDFVYEPDQQIYEPTVLLAAFDSQGSDVDSAKPGMIGELRYVGVNKKDNIRITKDVFRLGSSSQGNDSVIDSPVVSRYHARIRREGHSYYIEDLNSTNGTFLNGKPLGYHDVVELKLDDTIMFADECYKIV